MHYVATPEKCQHLNLFDLKKKRKKRELLRALILKIDFDCYGVQLAATERLEILAKLAASTD